MGTTEPPDPQATADAATIEQFMAALEAQFGDRLDDAARPHIRRQFATMLAQSRALAAYPLDAATEPAATFNPFPAE